jgi:hypothetical protein
VDNDEIKVGALVKFAEIEIGALVRENSIRSLRDSSKYAMGIVVGKIEFDNPMICVSWCDGDSPLGRFNSAPLWHPARRLVVVSD